jgi:hypothetical protein
MSTGKTAGARRTGPALEKMHQFVLWLVLTLEKFPRSQKFMPGDRIQSSALDALEGLIEATYTRNRTAILRRVNLRLKTLRYLVRLAMDLRYFDKRRFEFAARSVDEIGRRIHGPAGRAWERPGPVMLSTPREVAAARGRPSWATRRRASLPPFIYPTDMRIWFRSGAESKAPEDDHLSFRINLPQ